MFFIRVNNLPMDLDEERATALKVELQVAVWQVQEFNIERTSDVTVVFPTAMLEDGTSPTIFLEVVTDTFELLHMNSFLDRQNLAASLIETVRRFFESSTIVCAITEFKPGKNIFIAGPNQLLPKPGEWRG